MFCPIRGLRAIELEVADVARGADFFTRVWNLQACDGHDGAVYLRGTGAYHHILALHPAEQVTRVRRIVFDAGNRSMVDDACKRVQAATPNCEKPRNIVGPNAGYGFGFADGEGRNYAIICSSNDGSAQTDHIDRPRKIAHVNINTLDVEKTTAFFVDVLGFKVIDRSGPLTFLHCDSSDHSAIVVCAASQPTLNHIAFELPLWESVMRGAGRMRDAGYPIEWGVGRHSAGNNVFAYFAGPEEIPLEYTAEVAQVDDSYVPHGPEYWRFPPGRLDQWGVTPPHTARWKRIQDMHPFSPGHFKL